MKIEFGGRHLATVFRKEDWREGLAFLTHNDDFLQVGTWEYDNGKRLKAHAHKDNPRTIQRTQEVVYLVSGKMMVYVYDGEEIVSSVILNKGDLCILLAGGHSYEILAKKTRVLEVKCGQFNGVENDKMLL